MHWLQETAFSARYEEVSEDRALHVWLCAARADNPSVAAVAAAAAALGLAVRPADPRRTAALPVFRAERDFHGDEAAGLDAGFFERLAAFVGLPAAAPPEQMDRPPPAAAWPAMIWLSMTVAAHGVELWDWYMEDREADEAAAPEVPLLAHEGGRTGRCAKSGLFSPHFSRWPRWLRYVSH